MSSNRRIHLVMMLAIFAAGLLFFYVPALHAQTAAPTVGAAGANCSQYVGLTNRIASCVRATLGNATGAFFSGFYPMVSQAITAFITLGVIIYGVAAVSGFVEKLGRDSIMLILKIALITFFVTNSDLMYENVLSMMDATASSVIGFNPTDGEAVGQAGDSSGQTSFSQIKCMQNMISAQAANASNSNINPVPGPWMGMDCIIDSVIGIKIATSVGAPAAGAGNKWYNDNLADADNGPARGMLYLFFSSMQTSVIGLLFAIVGFIFVYGMIHLIIKALFIYLGGYIGIAFMIIISPIFIPMVLFKATKPYFDKWVELVINFALQPIIVLIFVSFSIAAMDLATYSGSYSIMYRLAGDASQQAGFSLNNYLTTNNAIIRKPATLGLAKADDSATGAPAVTKVVGGAVPNLATVQCFLNSTDPKCTNTHPFQLWHDAIDWDKLAAARSPAVTMADGATTPGQQIAREVLSAVIFSGIVVFVMNGLLQIVPTIITDLLGDFGYSPNLMRSIGRLPGSGRGGAGGIGGAVGSLTNAMAGLVGKRS